MSNQGQFSSSEVLTAADLNGFTMVTALQGSFSVANNQSGGQNVTFGAGSEVIDVGGWHSTSSDTHKITPTVTGLYLIIGNGVNFNSPNRALINIVNAAGVIASQDNADGAFDLSVSVVSAYTVGENGFNLNCYQNSGSTVSPFFRFSVQLIRAT